MMQDAVERLTDVGVRRNQALSYAPNGAIRQTTYGRLAIFVHNGIICCETDATLLGEA
jgi:hypothetical protein